MSDTATLAYFEDFPVGLTRDLGSRGVSEEEIMRFAREFDPQPFHVDRDAAEHSIFGGIIASGWHTCALVMRILCDGFLLQTVSMGSPGVDEVRWRRPVRGGDTLTVSSRVREAKPSTSKPDRGILVNEIEVRNQRDEVVLTMLAMTMLARRPHNISR